MLESFLPFIKNHWILCSATLVCTILITFEELKDRLSGIGKVTVQELVLLINRNKAIVFDLRPAPEFTSGHIAGAINYYSGLQLPLNKSKGKEKNIDTAVIIFTNNKSLSSKIVAEFKQMGFTNLYQLTGGINTWLGADLPLVKK
jgi:Rhodanese-related sulfurtransferase